MVSDVRYIGQHPDFVANQRLLAEGYLNNNDPELIARTDLQKKTLRHILTVVMTRPH
jgi:hypothetical protein